ncbi:MAG: hypothetical protein M9947_07220 [Thermomicrobiales bacterium]|nr:hypothetical protein [Thermomicrobiales bacterium]
MVVWRYSARLLARGVYRFPGTIGGAVMVPIILVAVVAVIFSLLNAIFQSVRH